ncbi:MAG: hypothetical protein EOP05_03470 [Proteobacteria bacterium]|nr:MAG: hypothetical protein EOP05_03470 [Pseudomonadota bacterium]
MMKNKVNFASATALTVLISFAPNAFSAEFSGVNDLQAIKADYDKLGNKPALKLDKERNLLQREASNVIKKMPDANNHLSDKQIGALTNLLSIAVPVDPTSAIVQNNSEIIKANLPKLKAEILKLPANEQQQVLESIDLYVAPTK